jgi:hypothetical protein
LLKKNDKKAEKKVDRKAEKKNALLTRQLRRKFGVQPQLETALQRLPELPLKRLEDLADALLDFAKTDELHEWLQGMPDLNKRACPFYFSSMS